MHPALELDGEDEATGPKALTEAELRAVLAEVPSRWQLLVTLLAQTGLRIAEALPLRWGDIDFDRRRVLVRRSFSGRQIGPPKTRP